MKTVFQITWITDKGNRAQIVVPGKLEAINMVISLHDQGRKQILLSPQIDRSK